MEMLTITFVNLFYWMEINSNSVHQRDRNSIKALTQIVIVEGMLQC
jgi:hypothetical protein